MRHILIPIILWASIAVAQTDSTYVIPFASKGNTIDLTVANTSKIAAQTVSVAIKNAPEWVKFDSSKQIIKSLAATTEQNATFSFAVDKSAPVGKEQTLTFTITTNNQTWTKDIAIKVAAPAAFTLYQNYPNPFNPTTIISYELSKDSRVRMRIYDILGRAVMVLADEQQAAGYYQKTFNAQRLASGVYICELLATDSQNTKHVFHKKMLLLR
jgi:hypothetical protein